MKSDISILTMFGGENEAHSMETFLCKQRNFRVNMEELSTERCTAHSLDALNIFIYIPKV